MWEKQKNGNQTESFGNLGTAQKMKFSIKGFFSKCDQIHSFLQIQSHLLKKSFIENFLFYSVRHRHFGISIVI